MLTITLKVVWDSVTAFSFWGKSPVESFKRRVVHREGGILAKPARFVCQGVRLEFQGEKGGGELAAGGLDVEPLGAAEPEPGVIPRVAVNADGRIAQRLRRRKGMLEQAVADPLFLQRRKDAERAERDYGETLPAVAGDHRLGVNDMPHDFAVQFGHEIELGDERPASPEFVKDKMLDTAREIDVPERFPRQLLDLPVVIAALKPYCWCHDASSFVFGWNNLPCRIVLSSGEWKRP